MSEGYRLSPTAIHSIEQIIIYTEENFGPYQTEAYIAGLKSSFRLIMEFAGIGVAAFEIKPGLRRYRYQSHYIFYTDEGDHVRIEDVIHVKRRIRPDLFDT